MTASCVLASLNASTYWKVRLGISLAAALLRGLSEHPGDNYTDAHDTPQIKGILGRGRNWHVVQIYMNLRRLNALISSIVRSNHSPLPRFASNRLCQ